MYIYELPFDINKELCRLLDHDDDWKELAGVHMKFSPFDVNEIEQEARRSASSPCNQLFICWGQLNHTVPELFILLHKMRHVPAMKCLVPVVEEKFHKLLKKDIMSLARNNMENINKQRTQAAGSTDTSIPLPVMLIENGFMLPTSSNDVGRSTTDNSSTDTSSNYARKNDANYELMRNVSAIPMLSYEDLKQATGNWSDENLLGRGGFGQVYKGEWKLLPVAVKRLKDNDGKNKELIRELCLNQYRHDNILPLYGYSLGGPEACLVYQLMLGGSLEQRLRCKTHHPPLTWCQRYMIAHGVARGLQYLHTMTGTPLIHGDIKPANILLDQCSIPKIGDFGLARRGPYEKSHLKVSKVHGTRPYLPDEYLRSCCLSTAIDVFSFGVLIVEMATALHALDRGRTFQLLSDYVHALVKENYDFAILEDRLLKDSPRSNPMLCRHFVAIGIECTNESRHQRPSMLDVYRRLDAIQFPGKDD